MTSLLIPCPECGRELRLRDRKLLGRRAKCPNCEHRWVLTEPEEVELELADSNSVVGTDARWIPDGQSADSSTVAALPNSTPIDAGHIQDSQADGAALPANTGDTPLRPRRRNRMTGLIVGGLLAVLVAGTVVGIAIVVNNANQRTVVAESDNEPPQRNEAYEAGKQDLEDNAAVIDEFDPTSGGPIELLYIPSGTSVVIQLRPAEIWQSGGLGEEVRACLGPLTLWAEQTIAQHCLFEPSQIEELLICISLGPRGSEPEYSGVVRLTEIQKRSELVDRFQANRDDSFGPPYYRGEETAYAIISQESGKSFAFCPVGYADEMLSAQKSPNVTDSDIESILLKTDRDRHITVVFEPADLRRHQDTMFPESMYDLVDQLLTRLGDDVETVAWSIHLDEEFHSDFILRNNKILSPERLHRKMYRELERLPEELIAAIKMMRPETLGGYRLIGRFPAMIEAFRRSTIGAIDERSVRLTTILPERAAPNLALASLLTWNEASRTDFSTEPAPLVSTPELPNTVVERMQLTLEIDFRKQPLQEAFNEIGEAMHVTIELDGQGLMQAAYTKNLEQNFQLGVVTAREAIAKILSQYDLMCVVIDEENMRIIVTTYASAKAQNLTPYSFE